MSLSVVKAKVAAEAVDPSKEAQDLLAKWKVALAVGVPVAAVVGLAWYWYRSGEVKETIPKESTSTRTAQVKGVPVNRSPATAAKPEPSVNKRGIDAAEAATARGNKFYREGRYAEALKEFSEAVALCPETSKRDLAILYRNRAACYENLKDYENVIKECSKALELNPKYIKAWNLRAHTYQKLDKLEDALFDITSSCILDGFQTPTSMSMADEIIKEIGARKAKEYIRTRKAVLPSNYFIKNYFSSFCEDPISLEVKRLKSAGTAGGDCNGRDPVSHYTLALEAVKDNDFERVVAECDLFLNGGQDDSEPRSGVEMANAYLLRGTMYFLMGDGPSALKDFAVCMELPECPLKVKVNALVKRACQHLQDEEAEECLQDFQLALKLDPSNGDVFHHRGQVMLLLEKFDAAMSDFDKAAALHPNFPPPQIQRRLGEYRRAFKEGNASDVRMLSEKFRETVEKFPECADGFSIYGQILVDLLQFDKAEQYMDRAHKIDPNNAMILVHKGLLKVQERANVDEAVKWITRAIELDDKCEYAYETLATLEVQRGNLKRGVELFDKAIHLGKTELELTQLFSLRVAASVQVKIIEEHGISVTGGLAMAAAAAASPVFS